MITLIEALHFRCLKYIRQPLGPFHVLVGPNASGKTTFLDVIGFLGRLVSDGLDAAIEERSADFHDLVWMREGTYFELAVEASIPEEKRGLIAGKQAYDTVRYQVRIGVPPEKQEQSILSETVTLKSSKPHETQQRDFFPRSACSLETIVLSKSRSQKLIVKKSPGRNDNFYSETYDRTKGKGWAPSFKLGPAKSALGNLIEDETNFPVSTWLRTLLSSGIQRIVLNSLLIRAPSPPRQGRSFKPDGSNISWLIAVLKDKEPERFRNWIAHLRTALPDIADIKTVTREEDRHCYLVIRYDGGLEVPSWMVSDGTLRLLALTLPAYLSGMKGIYLVEEPENGVHPRAVEAMFQSLSSVYDAQVLLATHSPVILSLVDPSKTLCFGKTSEGATDIVSGDEHPALRDWQGETNLGVLFASGVLG